MPIYRYEAKSLSGQVMTNTKEAGSIELLTRLLKDDGLELIRASEEKVPVMDRLNLFVQNLLPVGVTEKMLFTRYLFIIVKAGFSLNKALGILIMQTQSLKMRSALDTIRSGIIHGSTLSDEMKKFPNIFSDLYVNMVSVGERSGTLEESLKLVAKDLQKEHQLKSRIRGAMVYPSVILTALVGIGILMMIFVIPQLQKVFADMGVTLPLSTQILLNSSTVFMKIWPFLLLALLALVYIFWKIRNRPYTKRALGWFVLRSPFIKDLTQKINTARIARTLGSLLSSGVSLTEALQITAGATSNFEYKNSLLETAKMVEKGTPIHQTLEKYPRLYPPLVSQMISVGEETGALASILLQLAGFYESEVSSATKNMSSIVEPVIMIIVGIAVGYFAIAILQPMYSLANQL